MPNDESSKTQSAVRQIDTRQPESAQGRPNNLPNLPKQPHEHDESPAAQPTPTHRKIEQAAKDLKEGQVDTDLRGERGVEKVMDKN